MFKNLQIHLTILLQGWNVMLVFIALWTQCHAWLPDTVSKVFSDIGQLKTYKFAGNSTFPDHFIVLQQDENSILLGARNVVYNLSVLDFSERVNSRFEWKSTDAHTQLCILKGKTAEEDCQNYIRILVITKAGTILVCGTNSFKPLCRQYLIEDGKYVVHREDDGIGVCPYNPEHNSTAVYSNGQLFSATVADFSGGDPLIYRSPQRTELSDLRQLNAPSFVSSIPYGEFIFFFFRETAVEFINCGKVIYSRVARVCIDDKGGPHHFRHRWTSFLKTRLNCSVPGDYPFYFNEIQSTSDLVEGKYGSDSTSQIIYGTFTTPSNAIGGSAICVYNMRDILKVFDGNFKHQDGINSNWLPLPDEKVPKDPRPGHCVRDSRILPENNVNFLKAHSLMENAVPSMFGQPILIRVSLQYRYTSIAVDAQVRTVNGEVFDVLYVGTDNGKILKLVNIPSKNDTAKAVVISESVILPNASPVTQIKIAPGYGNVIVVGRDEARLAKIVHCTQMRSCKNCVHLQDPHCAWDSDTETCIVLGKSTINRALVQNVILGFSNKCLDPNEPQKIPPEVIITNSNIEIKESYTPDQILKMEFEECDNRIDSVNCAVKHKLVIYTAETVQLFVVCAAILCLLVGFICGYIFSRRFQPSTPFPNTPSYIEQHNRFEGFNQSNFLSPRPNKSVNLNVPMINTVPPPKKDNLEASKDVNVASDGTLQKIKKTYL